jgi:hypothetical protein
VVYENLYDLVGELALLGREALRHVPAQPSSDVVMHPCLRARELVGAPMQLSDLLEQRLQDLFVDPHRSSGYAAR